MIGLLFQSGITSIRTTGTSCAVGRECCKLKYTDCKNILQRNKHRCSASIQVEDMLHGRPSSGSGGLSPRKPEKFLEISKTSLKKIPKYAFVQSNLNKIKKSQSLRFADVEEKYYLLGYFESFEKLIVNFKFIRKVVEILYYIL